MAPSHPCLPAYFFLFFFLSASFHFTHNNGTLQISDENRPSHCLLSIRTTVMILAGKYSVVVRTRGTGGPPSDLWTWVVRSGRMWIFRLWEGSSDPSWSSWPNRSVRVLLFFQVLVFNLFTHKGRGTEKLLNQNVP